MTAYAQGHPIQRPSQSFEDHQRDMAKWMGCETVEDMNRCHDPMHAEMAQ